MKTRVTTNITPKLIKGTGMISLRLTDSYETSSFLS